MSLLSNTPWACVLADAKTKVPTIVGTRYNV